MKDHNAPKRPLSGYMAYIGTIREKTKKETGLKGIQLAPTLANHWKGLSDAQRAKFNNASARKMETWKKKMAAYKQTKAYKDFQIKKKAKKFKKPKDQNAPKRPMNAYFIFTNSVRAKIQKNLGTEDFGTIAKEVKSQWNDLSDAEKQKFQAKAEKAKAKYQKVLAKYKTSKAYKQYEEKLSEFKAKKKAAFQKDKKIVKRKK